MTKPEPENAEMDLRSGNMLGLLEALRGSNFFVKTVHASHVPRKRFTCNGLVLPRWFVKDNGEKLYKYVVLLTYKAALAGNLFNGVASEHLLPAEGDGCTERQPSRSGTWPQADSHHDKTGTRKGRNDSEVEEYVRTLRGDIVFIRTLHATHVPRKNCKCNGLSSPQWFVEDNMENLYKSVVLLTNKVWSLRCANVRCRPVLPAVVFSGGWKAFAISCNLAEGNQLIFKLSAASQFDVDIFNADGTPKTVATPNEKPMNKSDVSELPKMKIMKSSECRHEHPAAEEKKPSANGLCGFFAKEEIRELPLERKEDADEYNRDRAPREKQKSHPSFSKRLTQTNLRRSNGAPCLEMPAKFARTHGARRQTPVKLQGIYEESPVCTVTCGWERSRSSLRLFLRSIV